MAKINTRPSTDAFEGGDINFKRPSQAKEIIRRLKKNKGARATPHKDILR